MSMPSLSSVFLIKESVDSQHWTSNGVRYNVGRLYDWVSQHRDPFPIELALLKHGFDNTSVDEDKGSETFWKRANAAGDDPILVVVDENDDMWIADGNHRFARAWRDGEGTITGYVVGEWELPEDAIEPKGA
jgi:hypothetical protein